jgi:hypothetical protein
VADEMRALEALFVQIAFGPVDNVANRGWSSLYRGSAAVPYRGRCVYLVIATKKWDDILPCATRRGEAMQENDGPTVRRHAAKSYTSRPKGTGSSDSAIGIASVFNSRDTAADHDVNASENQLHKR